MSHAFPAIYLVLSPQALVEGVIPAYTLGEVASY